MMKYTIVNSEMRSLFNITPVRYNVNFFINDNNFILFIDFFFLKKDGEIFTKIGLDREKRSQYVFTVKLEEKHPSTKIVRKIVYFI